LYGEIAERVGLNRDELRQALEEQTLLRQVRDDFSGGVRSGVNGTPTFFIQGERFNGPKDFEHMAPAIEDAIAK
jgi:predicted DsbA family dithiol-disulfide isomerase